MAKKSVQKFLETLVFMDATDVKKKVFHLENVRNPGGTYLRFFLKIDETHQHFDSR